MIVITINPTTQTSSILDQLQFAVSVDGPVQIGRFEAHLRGSMWMIRDSITGLESLDGIMNGTVGATARALYDGWKSGRWNSEVDSFEAERPLLPCPTCR